MPRSFRDPDGFVFRSGGRVLRCVLPHALEDLQCFLSSPLAAELMSARKLAFTEELPNGAARELLAPGDQSPPAGALVFEHRPASFPNYPYEWAPEMAHFAAGMTIQTA